MNCPYCKKEMEMYEHYDEYIDDDTLKIEEHWWCNECHKTFSRDVFYQAVSKGVLEE
jgi:transposase-like protein